MKKITILSLILIMFAVDGMSNGNKTILNLTKMEFKQSNDAFNKKFVDEFSRRRRRRGGRRNMYQQGKMFISVGYGLPNFSMNYYFAKLKAFGNTAKLKAFGNTLGTTNAFAWGVAHARFDYGLWNAISMGADINFSSYNISYDVQKHYLNVNGGDSSITYTNGYSGMTLNFLIRFDWHYYSNKHIDLYTGVGLGYSYNNAIYYSDNISMFPDPWPMFNLPIAYGGGLGIRIFFNKQVGMYAEIGYNTSLVNLGMTFRI